MITIDIIVDKEDTTTDKLAKAILNAAYKNCRHIEFTVRVRTRAKIPPDSK